MITCYTDHVNKIVRKLDFEIVVYDETENFPHYTSPLFNYPYESRKSKIMTLRDLIFDSSSTATYKYISQKAQLMLSDICIDSSPWDGI